MKDLPKYEILAGLDSVTKVYSDHGKPFTVLDEISFHARAGEVVLLLGPSGSGKSTLLTILAGLQRPTAGKVVLFGTNLESYNSAGLQKMRAASVGFIFQAFHLIDSLNALENIMLVMRFNHLRGKYSRKIAKELLEKLDIEYLEGVYPARMSQGEKQRVAVARALANNARLIIADEPTGSLATNQGMKIISILKQAAKSEDRGIIIASHDTRIGNYADRILHLHDGRLE